MEWDGQELRRALGGLAFIVATLIGDLAWGLPGQDSSVGALLASVYGILGWQLGDGSGSSPPAACCPARSRPGR